MWTAVPQGERPPSGKLKLGEKPEGLHKAGTSCRDASSLQAYETLNKYSSGRRLIRQGYATLYFLLAKEGDVK